MKHYAERDTMAQGQAYCDHVMAMTVEGLHAKSDIAAELAHRDLEIKRLHDLHLERTHLTTQMIRERDEARAEADRLRMEVDAIKRSRAQERDYADTCYENERLREAFRYMLSAEMDWRDGDVGIGHRFRALARRVLDKLPAVKDKGDV